MRGKTGVNGAEARGKALGGEFDFKRFVGFPFAFGLGSRKNCRFSSGLLSVGLWLELVWSVVPGHESIRTVFAVDFIANLHFELPICRADHVSLLECVPEVGLEGLRVLRHF